MTRPPTPLKLKSSTLEEIKIDDSNTPVSPFKMPLSAYSPRARPTVMTTPSQDNSIPPRPRPFVFSTSTLLEIPSRLARPPSVKSVRKRWTIVPEMAVSLEEILAMRHLSPLSLKDFEQYLLFEEYGAENLYFLLWLDDYTSQFHSSSSSRHLYHSVARAKATFFSPDSQYELNLAALRISEFYALVDSAAPGEFPALPHPEAFVAIREDVEVMLRTSARRFVQSRSRNAGTQRALCVVFGGLLTMAIAFAPLMISRFSEHNRYIRFGMIPPIWLGFTIFLCSANGICLVLYLMGGSRQLHPFELNRPAISAPALRDRPSYQASLVTLDTTHDPKSPPMSPGASSFVQYPTTTHSLQGARAAVSFGSLPDIYVLPRIRPVTPILESDFEFATAGFIPSQQDDTHTISDQASTYVESTLAHSTAVPSTGALSSATKFTFDFDALPAKTLNSATGPPVLQAAAGKGIKGSLTRVLAPVTCVRSSVISRAQWEIVIRSMAVAAMVALIVSCILVAVPI